MDYGRYEGRRYARGGFYPGGLALVGEEGPEFINFHRPGQVYTADQTQDILHNMMRPASNDNALVGYVRQLTQQNERMYRLVDERSRASIQLQHRLIRQLERWETDGLPDTREEMMAQVLAVLQEAKEDGWRIKEAA